MQEITGDGASLPLEIGLYRCPATVMSPMCGLTPGHQTKRQEGHIKGRKMHRGWTGKRGVTIEVTITGELSLPLCSVLEAW